MQGLPANGHPETVYLYAVVLVVFGCLKSWVSPVCPSRILLHCMQTSISASPGFILFTSIPLLTMS